MADRKTLDHDPRPGTEWRMSSALADDGRCVHCRRPFQRHSRRPDGRVVCRPVDAPSEWERMSVPVDDDDGTDTTLPVAVVFSAGWKHWRVAVPRSFRRSSRELTLGSWMTPGGASRAAQRSGFAPVVCDNDADAKRALSSL